MLKLTLIIPTLNRPKAVLNMISRISSFEYLSRPNQIIIVDQSDIPLKGTDVTKMCCDLKIDLFRLDFKSLTKARNLGVQHAKNNIIVFSDDDIEFDERIFLRIYNLGINPKISMIAGLEQNSLRKPRIISYLSLSRSYLNRKVGHVSKSVIGNYPVRLKDITVTNFSMGGFFVVKKKLLEKTRVNWDENLVGHGYPEDLDFSYRYSKACEKLGYYAIIDKKVSVTHKLSNEYLQLTDNQLRSFIVNRYYISLKIFGTIDSIIFVFIHNTIYSVYLLTKFDKRFISIAALNLFCLVKIKELKTLGIVKFKLKFKLNDK
jgi:glycosyltransferase involved in cell wall biosynthesis